MTGAILGAGRIVTAVCLIPTASFAYSVRVTVKEG